MQRLPPPISRPLWLLTLVVGSLMVSPVRAAPFTCAAFKDRLNGALVAAKDPGAEAPAFKDNRATDAGGSHLNWNTSALSGSLACGADDRFQEFYVSLDVTTRDKFVEQLKRFVTLNGAIICTLAKADPDACTEVGKRLLQEGLERMGAGFKRRVSNPNGLSTRMLWPDVKAELTAAPSLITFSLAAADGVTPDGGRRDLQAATLPSGKAPPPVP